MEAKTHPLVFVAFKNLFMDFLCVDGAPSTSTCPL
jgi:hypothetical protein